MTSAIGGGVRSRPETIPVAAALASVGGFLDAYTYVAHNGVLANAQTGNVVLAAVAGAAGRWTEAGRHVPALVAFLGGILVGEFLSVHRRLPVGLRPTRVVLILEILVCAALAMLGPVAPDQVAIVAIAFAAALQITTFRAVGDATTSGDSTTYTTTMTTGNLRSLVVAAYRWQVNNDRAQRAHASRLGVVVLGFVVGATVGGLLARHAMLGTRAVVVPAAVLVVVLLIIMRQTHHLEEIDPARRGALTVDRLQSPLAAPQSQPAQRPCASTPPGTLIEGDTWTRTPPRPRSRHRRRTSPATCG